MTNPDRALEIEAAITTIEQFLHECHDLDRSHMIEMTRPLMRPLNFPKYLRDLLSRYKWPRLPEPKL